MPLTAKQQRFVAEYLVDGAGRRAAIAAGYGGAGAAVTAHRLIHANRAVQAEIRVRQSLDSQRLQIERQDVIAGLLEGIAMAKNQHDPAGMISGWKAIAGMLGLMAPQRVQVDVQPGDTVQYETMTEAELMAVMAGCADC